MVNGAITLKVLINSDVPQGSVLGPLLFKIYINEIIKLKFSPYTKLTLFADDISFSKVMCDEDVAIRLQSDIDLIYKWSVQKYLSFNVGKCKFMIFFQYVQELYICKSSNS